MKTHTTNAM